MGLLSFGMSDALSLSLEVGLSSPRVSIIYLIVDLPYTLRGGLMTGLDQGLSFYLFLAIGGGLLVWSLIGGLTILRHYVIRLLLARSHTFPWRAQAFLDDAVARILMHRVGGGYSFVHRRLQDYFAEVGTTEPKVVMGQMAETDAGPSSPTTLDTQ